MTNEPTNERSATPVEKERMLKLVKDHPELVIGSLEFQIWLRDDEIKDLKNQFSSSQVQLKVTNKTLNEEINYGIKLQSERDQLKKELAETKRDVADAEAHYINLGNELSLKLITANKIIDQCEEALKFYAQEWHTETGDLNYDLSIAVYTKAREALSTIQSLKLKWK